MKNLLPALALATIASPVLADDGFSLTTGFDYTTGKYGNATSTDILYIPVTGQYQSGDMTLTLTVPYISVTGPGGVIRGFGRVSSAPTATAGSFGRPRGGGDVPPI